MRRLTLVASLAAAVAACWGGQAAASPLRLSIEGGGGAFVPSVKATVPVGIGSQEMGFASSDFAELYTYDFGDSITEPIATPFSFRVVLEDVTTGGALAELTLAGVVEGSMTHLIQGSRQVVTTSAIGEATASDFKLADGITLDQIPLWFPSLSARVVFAGDPASETNSEVLSTLTIAAQIPEPSSALVFLAAAGTGLMTLRRRRGRTSATPLHSSRP